MTCEFAPILGAEVGRKCLVGGAIKGSDGKRRKKGKKDVRYHNRSIDDASNNVTGLGIIKNLCAKYTLRLEIFRTF